MNEDYKRFKRAMCYLEELVEFRITKKLEFNKQDSYSYTKHEYVLCPNCEREFKVKNEEHYNFCPDCGQALNWLPILREVD